MNEGYGEFIKNHRIKSGYKRQNELADVSNISAATISRIEKEIQKPNVETLQALTKHLISTTYEELMSVCGYSYNDYNSNEITDVGIVDKLGLTVDYKKITHDELIGMLTYIRTMRQLK